LYYTRKNAQVVTSLQTSCYKSVHKLSTTCVRTACSQLLEQAVNNLQQAWWHYQTWHKVVLTSLIQSWYNKNVTRLATQGCNNIVISWQYQNCWNNLATNRLISTRLLQVVNSLFQICWQLAWDKQCEHNLLTACWQTCYKMWDFYVCIQSEGMPTKILTLYLKTLFYQMFFFCRKSFNQQLFRSFI
jgi:hypothetical protein